MQSVADDDVRKRLLEKPCFELASKDIEIVSDVSCDVFNSEFLSRLESCQSDPVLIARCFSQHSRGFSVYSSYCTNYPR